MNQEILLMVVFGGLGWALAAWSTWRARRLQNTLERNQRAGGSEIATRLQRVTHGPMASVGAAYVPGKTASCALSKRIKH